MPVQVLDVFDIANVHKDVAEPRGRTTALDTNRMHTVVLCYKTPRERDEMHCHNQDQTFYVVDGQATLHFPDGGHETVKPGMLATITGGDLLPAGELRERPHGDNPQPLWIPRGHKEN